jgi:hypothetical protein
VCFFCRNFYIFYICNSAIVFKLHIWKCVLQYVLPCSVPYFDRDWHYNVFLWHFEKEHIVNLFLTKWWHFLFHSGEPDIRRFIYNTVHRHYSWHLQYRLWGREEGWVLCTRGSRFFIYNFLQFAIDGKNNSKTKVEKVFFFIFMSSYAEISFLK